MNKAQAEQIPITAILEREGFTPQHDSRGGSELWYLPNPLREESESSFCVNPEKNAWNDFGTGKGGGVVQFVEAYAGLDFKNALGWLRNRFSQFSAADYQKKRVTPVSGQKTGLTARFSIDRIQPLQNRALIEDLAGRSLSPHIAAEYLQEAYYRDTQTGKRYFGTALGNQSGAWEIRNRYMKTCIGNKDFTVVKGNTESSQVQVFEGVTDFLSYLEMNNQTRPKDHCVILNSLTMAKAAADYIHDMHRQQPREVTLWLDNEPESKSAAREAVTTAQQHFAAMPYPTGSVSHQYSQYKDLNEHWLKTGQYINPQPLPVVPAPINDNEPGQHQRAESERRQEPDPPGQLGLF